MAITPRDYNPQTRCFYFDCSVNEKIGERIRGKAPLIALNNTHLQLAIPNILAKWYINNFK